VRPSQRQLPSPELVAAGPFDEIGTAPASAPRNAEIVRAHTAGMTLTAIAAEQRLSRSRVQQIVNQAAQEEAERHRADGCTDAYEYLSRRVRHCLRQNGLSTVDEVRNACLKFSGGAGLLRLPHLGKLKLRQIRRWLLLQTGDPRFDGPDAKHPPGLKS
jgi:hypothetical protein